MQVQPVKMNKEKARKLYHAYKKHKAYERPEDYQIMRTYQLIAQGHVVIQAMESIKQAGLNESGMPHLAITRADNKWCYLDLNQWGGGSFSGESYSRSNSRNIIKFEGGFFPRNSGVSSWPRAKAIVPIIPPQHRPKRGLENYHILWEAVWEKQPPVDPYLLRRIGESDMWVVLAAWNLTPVEQAAMRTRINAV